MKGDDLREGLERRDLELALGVTVVLGAIYAIGACRSIYVGDSGELVAAVHTLGVPHPTGYPLYVMLGKLWTLLVPLGSVAHRMSLFSAAAGAAAGGLLFLAARRLGLGRAAALVAAGVLAFAPSFWSQATIQRVYTLNALFVVAVTSAAVEWVRRGSDRWLLLACFGCGLGAANHTFMGVYGVALGLWAVAHDRRLLLRPSMLARCIGVTLLGLLAYAYLPLASLADPRLDWSNPETLDGFLDAVLRRDFWDRAWLESGADWLILASDYLVGIARELYGVGVVLLVVGLAAARSRGWPLGLLLLVMLANFVSMGLHGSRSDIFLWHRYYVPSYAMVALFCGLGAEVLASRLRGRARIVPFLVPAIALVAGWRTHDRSRYRIAEDYSLQLLEAVPPGASLVASDDNILFVLIYLQLVEGVRPDVDLILQGVGGADLPSLRFDPDEEPLYFTHHPNWDHPALEVMPVGLVFRTVRAGSPLPPVVEPRPELDGESDPRVPRDYLTDNLVGNYHYMIGVTYEQRDWPRALAAFDRARAEADENDVLFYNLGLIFWRNGYLEEAVACFERSAEINPRHIASNKPVRPIDRLLQAREELERVRSIERALGERPELAGLAPGSAERHLRLAELLEQAGEPLAARGQRLRALVPDRHGPVRDD